MAASMQKTSYYDFLQISHNADQETIRRVYRFLAARYHPDNPKSGNIDKFETLKAAYSVLSNLERRTEYDEILAKEAAHALPLSSSVDFMDSVAGELNRRLAVLAVLYFRRRANPLYPEVSLAEIETRMGFPRDYLDFTTWYLLKKGYITKADNSDFTLTAAGVDFVETQRANIPVLNKLLTNGAEPSAEDAAAARVELNSLSAPMIVLPDMNSIPDRRSTGDRRVNSRDRRATPTDRRLKQ
jgi:curved DNA-binding protein CbpA